jgi:hypothetical protein
MRKRRREPVLARVLAVLSFVMRVLPSSGVPERRDGRGSNGLGPGLIAWLAIIGLFHGECRGDVIA